MKKIGKSRSSSLLIVSFLCVLGTYSCLVSRQIPGFPTEIDATIQMSGTSVRVVTSTLLPDATYPTRETSMPTRAVRPSATVQPTTQPPLSAVFAAVRTAFASLPPGQYLTYYDNDLGDSMQVISLDGKIRKQFLQYYVYSIVPNGRKLIYPDDAGRLFIFDLNDNTVKELLLTRQGCTEFNGSPNLHQLAVWCDGEIYVLSLEDHSMVSVTHITREEQYYFFPLWSPDGKWIAFFNLTYPPNHYKTDPDDGLYLLDTSCLANPDTCPAKTRGPFQDNLYLQGPYSWSPDSQKLAIPSKSDTRPIKIFDLKTESFQNLMQTGGYGFARSIAWSPDGEWIAYSQAEKDTTSSQSIFLTPAKGGKPIQLVDNSYPASGNFWLTVPLPFHIGDTYTINDAGANLNLRQAPSLSAKVLMKLQTGEQVQILEGPVEADGYSWWKARVVSDGAEGWLVEQPEWYEPVDSQ
jgi:hypothetical protein